MIVLLPALASQGVKVLIAPVSLLVTDVHRLPVSLLGILPSQGRLMPLFLDFLENLAPTNSSRILISGMLRMSETWSRQVGMHPSCLSRINPSLPGNRRVTTKKPATESPRAQGLLFSEELSSADQSCKSHRFSSFRTSCSNPRE